MSKKTLRKLYKSAKSGKRGAEKGDSLKTWLTYYKAEAVREAKRDLDTQMPYWWVDNWMDQLKMKSFAKKVKKPGFRKKLRNSKKMRAMWKLYKQMKRSGEL